jgi:hypothetical protein
MPRHQIFSSDRSYSAQLVAPHAADVLTIVHHLRLKEAEVDCDGHYSFSVRLGDDRFWTVVRRDQKAEAVAAVA